MESDKEDVDAARVQGQVAGVEVSADQEPGVLKELVRDGEEGETSPDPLPSSLVAPPVEAAEGENGQGDAAQPAEVEGVEVGEAHPGGDGVHGIPKVLHSAASGDDSSGKRLLPAYHNPGEKQ